MMGEFSQNDYRRFSAKTNFAFRWFEFDIGFISINIIYNVIIIILLRKTHKVIL